MPKNKQFNAEASPHIEWDKLLVGRPTPPKQWWIGEAIERQTSNTELRAEAAVSLLCPYIGASPKQGSKLPQVTELANEYRRLFKSTAHFTLTCADETHSPHPDIYRAAVFCFLRLLACFHAVNPEAENSTETLFPELSEALALAVKVIKDLEVRGLKTDLKAGPLLRDVPGHSVKRSRSPKHRKTGKPANADTAAHPALKGWL